MHMQNQKKSVAQKMGLSISKDLKLFLWDPETPNYNLQQEINSRNFVQGQCKNLLDYCVRGVFQPSIYLIV